MVNGFKGLSKASGSGKGLAVTRTSESGKTEKGMDMVYTSGRTATDTKASGMKAAAQAKESQRSKVAAVMWAHTLEIKWKGKDFIRLLMAEGVYVCMHACMYVCGLVY